MASTTNTAATQAPVFMIPAYHLVHSMGFEPTHGGDYNTGYSILQDSNGRITVSAVGEITNPVAVTR